MLSLTLIILGILVALISMFLFINKSNTATSNKIAKCSALLSLVLLISSGSIMFNNHQQKVQALQAAQKQKSISQTKKKQATNDQNKNNNSNTKKLNQAVATSLAEDQRDAKNPPIPDPRYAYPDKIQSIEYTGDKTIKVQVKDTFLSLSNEEKTKATNYAQDCAISGFIMTQGAVSGAQRDKGLNTTVKIGEKIQGQSTKQDNRQYQWNQ